MADKTKEELTEELLQLLEETHQKTIDLFHYFNEDKQTTATYLNEIIRMLTTGEQQIPIVPIELEVRNFANHREEYLGKREQKLKNIVENNEKITEIFRKILPQKKN